MAATDFQSDSVPAQVEALLAQAREKESAGDAQGARALLDAAAAPLKSYGTWLYAHGALSLRLGELDQALLDFEAAVAREPELAEFRSNLGAALLEKAKAGDAAALERATKELEQAVKLAPRLPGAWHNLGTARLFATRYESALDAFDQALRMDPRHLPSLYNRAAALNGLGRHEACLKALDATLAVDPGFGPAKESRERTLAKLAAKKSDRR